MKKLLIIVFVLFSLAMYGQVPNWTVDADPYAYTMNVTGVLNFDAVESTDANDIVAAFIDGECRGVAKPEYVKAVDRWLAFLTIFSNESGDIITFKVYDASQNNIYTTSASLSYVINSAIGNALTPYVWSYPQLSSSANINSFAIEGEEKDAVIADNSIVVTMPYGSNLSSLIATFTTDNGAIVKIGDIVQQSGITVNNFTSAITYSVSSPDLTTFKDYTVTVVYGNAIPTNISLSDTIIDETKTIGKAIATISATDPDGSGSFVYSLVDGEGGNNNAMFTINGNVLKTADTLDYETTHNLTGRIKVEDNDGGIFEKSFVLYLNNINDETPDIIEDTVYINENETIGIPLYTVGVYDPDSIADSYTFSIIGGNWGNTFLIDNSSGSLSLQYDIDYEEKRFYYLEIKVNDGKYTNSGIITIAVVNLNDEEPDINSSEVNLKENTPVGTPVYQVVANDVDSLVSLTYSIISGNINQVFAIEPSTGLISVADTIDYEFRDIYTLKVSIWDSVYNEQAIVRVTILDEHEAPVINDTTFYLNENGELGDLVGQILVTDPDSTDHHYFEVLSGNTNNAFNINESNGLITLLTPNACNYEQDSIWILSIKVTDLDSTDLTSEAKVTVKLIDINEYPEVSDTLFTISENVTAGSFVGNFSYYDDDVNQVIKYSIVGGNAVEVFAIDSLSGDITVAKATINYEVTNSYSLIIKVIDNGSPSYSSQATVRIVINNIQEAPVISDTTFYVDENSTYQKVVGKLSVFDPDTIYNHYFEILSGNTNNAFQISDNDGTIRILSSDVCNYELDSIWQLNIKLTDLDSTDLTCQAVVMIKLNDLNEQPIITDTLFMIAEDVENNSFVGNIPYYDDDNNQIIKYTITRGNDDDVFAIDSLSGNIIVSDNQLLDFEKSPEYLLTVHVEDNGRLPLSNDCIVTIEIENVLEGNMDAANYMSPNSDGINDCWLIVNPELYIDCEFTIVDENGIIVFNQKGYDNNFDGTKNGNELPDGTYYYYVKCGGKYTYKGNITLKR